jgi:hypothetical protein
LPGKQKKKLELHGKLIYLFSRPKDGAICYTPMTKLEAINIQLKHQKSPSFAL